MLRNTQQRKIICTVEEETNHPLSPTELLQYTRKILPQIGLSTIYRAIRELLSSGWLRQIDIPGNTSRYEKANKPHHHHFLCRSCNTLSEIESCPQEIENISPEGFLTESHDITLFGLCNKCM